MDLTNKKHDITIVGRSWKNVVVFVVVVVVVVVVALVI